MLDVVYPLGAGSKWQDGELRYSLRAIEQNFLDLGRVFIVGCKPPWLTGVEHLDVKDTHVKNKDANLIDKVLAACDAGVSDQFLRSSDDQIILLPSHAADLKPCHAGNLQEKENTFWRSRWKRRLKRTMELLASRGLPTLHHDTHLPAIYDRELFRKVMASCDYKERPGYTINTLYFNQAGLVDPPRLSGEKVTLEKGVNKVREIRKRLEGKRYLGYNDAGLTGALKKLLQEMFPEPSRFETDGVRFVQGISFADTKPIPQVVAVIGTARSGTSCTAGIVHLLGVSMGEHLRQAKKRNPKGFFEDVPLRKICGRRGLRRRGVQRFRQWAMERGGTIIGGKDGKLCNRVPEIVQAWPNLKVIAVDRPMAEIVASMEKAHTFKRFRTPAAKEAFARNRIEKRDRDLESLKVNTLRLPFHDTLSDPAGTIQKIVEFLGISPTDQQMEAALAFVDPTLHHNKSP